MALREKRKPFKFTAAAIAKLPLPESGQEDVFDLLLPSFGVRISHGGTKAWFATCRIGGAQIRVTLGRHGVMSLADAHDAARDVFRKAERGIDPRPNKRKKRKSTKAQATSFKATADLFIERYAKKKNRQWKETERIFRVYCFPHWSRTTISKIKKADVAEMLDYVEDNHGGIMANRVLAAVRKLFNWAVDERGLLEVSPVGKTKARGKENRRNRVLTDSELSAIWAASGQLGYPFGGFIQTLLLTAQRRSEVSGLRWSELSEDLAVWTIPGDRAKNKEPHEVPLPHIVGKILADLPREENADCVFSSGRRGDRPISGYGKLKEKLDKLAKIEAKDSGDFLENWTLHDLRRSAATKMAELGINRFVQDRVLNHVDRTVGGIYDRHDYRQEKLAALEAWASYVQNLTDDRPAGNVVSING
jgi:integrase